MNNSVKKLGQRIKEFRKIRGMTQAELAEKVNLESKYISRIEMGISSPSFKTIEKLADVLSVSLCQLFNFPGDRDRGVILERLRDKINNYPLEKLELLQGFTNLIDTKYIQ